MTTRAVTISDFTTWLMWLNDLMIMILSQYLQKLWIIVHFLFRCFFYKASSEALHKSNALLLLLSTTQSLVKRQQINKSCTRPNILDRSLINHPVGKLSVTKHIGQTSRTIIKKTDTSQGSAKQEESSAPWIINSVNINNTVTEHVQS